MIIHDVVQGSPQWHALREKCWNASIAPAMRGESPYVRRDEAIAMAATCTQPEFSAWVLKNIIEKGHEIEVAGRKIAEEMLGEDLYPATVTEDIPGLSRPLLVSLDGLIMSGTITYECKQFNAELFAAVQAGDCLSYRFQVAQGLVITKAEKCLFMCTDGTKERTATCWITLRDGDARDLVAGWKQFEADVKNYTPPPAVVEVVGATIKELPALMVRVEGRVVDSNLGVFRQAARDLVAAIKTDLQDDQDFADADKATKWLKDGEDRLELVKKQAQSQAATIDDLFRTIDEIREGMREKRLVLEKLVTTRKEAIRFEIMRAGQSALAAHVAKLNELIGAPKPLMPIVPADFAGVMKGKRTIATLRNAVNTELARAQMAAHEIADRISVNLRLIAHEAGMKSLEHLFQPDLSQLVLKTPEDLALLIKDRMEQHRAAVEREEAARAATAAAIQTAQQPPASVNPAETGSRDYQLASGPTDPGNSPLVPSQAIGAAAIDIGNKFMVGMRGDDTLVIAKLRPDYMLTKAGALNMAAYLVALADDNDEFPALLRAVQNT